MKIEEIFKEKSAQLGIELTSNQLNKFKLYCDRLKEENQKYNLTSIEDDEGIYLKHFLDSISLLEWLDLKDKTVLDIGTGAGFPGVPLKIAENNADVFLLDSNHKKIEFLEQLISHLGLEGITSVYARVEDYLPEQLFDVVTSRAVGKLSVLFELSYPKLKVGGMVVAYKGEKYKDELNGSEAILKRLGVSFEVKKANLEGMSHYFVVFKKMNQGNLKPRNYAQMVKKPLW
jgi:16S rRNA (guanine527-N7)-methyltransferase